MSPLGKVATLNHNHYNRPGQDLAKEDIYSNVSLQVSQKDLEAYLLRAITSADTKEEFEVSGGVLHIG